MPPSSPAPLVVRLGRKLPRPVKEALRPGVAWLRAQRRKARLAKAARGPRPTLDEIGLATGTDKSSRVHGYLGVYESAFRHLRDERFELVEIGVHKGASIRMWAEYFPRAHLVGVDISPACKAVATDRIKIHIGDQSHADFLQRLAETTDPLIVIDDGSHVWRHQIETFRALFPLLRPGGFFVVEDIHTSFGEDYTKTYGKGDAESAYDYLAGITKGITGGPRADPPRDEFELYCRTTIESVQFLQHSVIVQKKSHPQGRYRTTSLADLQPGAHRTVVGPSYRRVPAQVVNAGAEVGEALAALVAATPVQVDDAATAVMHDVVVKGSLVLTPGGEVLTETLNCAQNIRFSSGMFRPHGPGTWVGAGSLEPAARIPALADGRTHVLLKQTWDANYGHWLIDGFPRFGLAREVVDPDRSLFVLNRQADATMRQVQLDSLALVGVAEEQVVFLDAKPYVFERLLVPGTLNRHPHVKAPFTVRFLEEVAATVPAAEGAERLYLSRSLAGRRRLLGEEEVVGLLEEHGYRVVQPETLSLREQIGLFRSATHVVGNMGAAMANLAFSPKGVSVLALATPPMKHDFFYDLVCHKEGRYRGLQGDTEEAAPTLSSDFLVDLGLLRESLSWLHGSEA